MRRKPLTMPKAQMVVGNKPNVKALVQQGALPPQVSSARLPHGAQPLDWTAERKAIVFNMLQWGIPIEDVATTVGCSVSALYRNCREEITHGRIHANTKVAEVFYKMATSGKVPAATLHWMKTRVPGFKDTIEHTGEISHAHSVIDPKQLSTEELRALEEIHARIAASTIDTAAEPA